MEQRTDRDRFVLKDGDSIAVIGGGPSGSFFSIFALKMARMIGKDINITIYDPKDFTRDGPGGCNRCGGVISELLVQTLAVEGINLPDTVVQRGINSYKLFTEHGSTYIATPGYERRIATVYRGGGPKGMVGSDKESFDQFLLDLAIKEGATYRRIKVERIEYTGNRPVVYSKNERLQEADLIVGAVGVNTSSLKLFEDLKFGYRTPETAMTAMAEIAFDREVIREHFGDSIYLFLLPIKNIKFAAIIPKGTYVTVCILGKKIDGRIVNNFLEHPVVRGAMPKGIDYKINCRCMPKMNVRPPAVGFGDRVVMCGDAGSTRLFKDGIGAAYIMGKAAAKTAVFEGVSRTHFQEHYYPVYKDIIIDNRYGAVLYAITDLYRGYGILTRGMLEIVNREQADPASAKQLSTILWGMFTGNERFKNIFHSAIILPFRASTWKAHIRVLIGRDQ